MIIGNACSIVSVVYIIIIVCTVSWIISLKVFNYHNNYTFLYASDDIGSTIGHLYQASISVNRITENIVTAIVNVRNFFNKSLL